MARGTGRAAGGFFLLEALVSLLLLGIVLTLGAGFFSRRRDLEKDRLDCERALRALASEWVFVRTASPHELFPRENGLFVGPGAFVDGLDKRRPTLTIRGADVPGLLFVHLEIGYGVRTERRLAQEGYAATGGTP